MAAQMLTKALHVNNIKIIENSIRRLINYLIELFNKNKCDNVNHILINLSITIFIFNKVLDVNKWSKSKYYIIILKFLYIIII